jgi:hypothetical protein
MYMHIQIWAANRQHSGGTSSPELFGNCNATVALVLDGSTSAAYYRQNLSQKYSIVGAPNIVCICGMNGIKLQPEPLSARSRRRASQLAVLTDNTTE